MSPRIRLFLFPTALLTTPLMAHAMTMPHIPGSSMPQTAPHGLQWVTWQQARQYASLTDPHTRGRHGVVFRGQRVTITFVAHAPQHPDMSFEAGGRTDPTVYVNPGARVTLRVLNMDYGNGMQHGLVITIAKPPYPVVLTCPLPDTLARVPTLPPRSQARPQAARYAQATTTFVAPRAGTYYYLCPVPGHARAFRMYGRFVIRAHG